MKKLSKISSGISGLEALTSKLKMSFNDEEKVQTSEDIHADKKEEPKNATKAQVKVSNATATKADSKVIKLNEVSKAKAATPAAKPTPKSSAKPVVKTVAKTDNAKTKPSGAKPVTKSITKSMPSGSKAKSSKKIAAKD